VTHFHKERVFLRVSRGDKSAVSFVSINHWKCEWCVQRRSNEIALDAQCSIHHRPRRTFRKRDLPEANSPFSRREASRF
jgi:hypothetical protein